MQNICGQSSWVFLFSLHRTNCAACVRRRFWKTCMNTRSGRYTRRMNHLRRRQRLSESFRIYKMEARLEAKKRDVRTKEYDVAFFNRYGRDIATRCDWPTKYERQLPTIYIIYRHIIHTCKLHSFAFSLFIIGMTYIYTRVQFAERDMSKV